MQNSEIVLVGGSGKTGGRIMKRLEERGLKVRVASRSSVRPFDWEDRLTWPGALQGASSAYVAFQPDLSVAWAAEAIEALAKTAVECGLEHIVLLSGRGEEAEPFIDADDIADVAVAALTDPSHRNKAYELTGPRALTFREAVAEIAAAAGRPITYEQVSMADFIGGLAAAGLPQDLIDLLEELFGQVLDGRNSSSMSGVPDILGRPATDFSHFARRTAASGIWSV